MKKLLLALLFLPASLFADTTSTGTVYFRIPSTGVIDTSKRWDTKINENLQIAATEITNIKSANSVIATDTTTLHNVFRVYTGTADARMNTIATDTGTLNAFRDAANSTMTALSASTNTLRNRFNDVATDTTTLANRTPTLAIYEDAGTFRASATTLVFGDNLTTSNVGSTVTVTGSAGGAGGGVDFPTVTVHFTIPRDVFFASTTRIPISGASFPVSKSTFNVLAIDSFLEYPSTNSVGWTAFRIGVSTVANYPANHTPSSNGLIISSFSWMTGDLHISSQSNYGLYYSTKFTVNQDSSFFVGITSIPSLTAMPRGLHVNVWGWFNKNTSW